MFDGLPESLMHGAIRMDVHGMRVFVGDQEIPLTLRQFEVLLYFLLHPTRVVTRQDLMSFRRLSLRDIAMDGLREEGPRAADVSILGLRHKLGYTAIETVRGVGYRLAAPSRIDSHLAGSADDRSRHRDGR